MLFRRFDFTGFFLLALMVSIPLVSTAAEIRNINFAVFQKESDEFEFDPIVLGKFSDFINVMEGTQLLLLSHSKNAINEDVINIQQNVLRESTEGLNDIGVSCSLTFLDLSIEDDLAFELGGMCKIFDSLNKNVMAIISMASLPDTDQGIEAWVMLHEDEASGIAFYANVSSDY